MKRAKRCPSCRGKEFREDLQREERGVAGYIFAAKLKVSRCCSCGEPLIALSELGRFDREIAGWLAREGVLSGEAFRFMRKSIGLKANELAQLLELTPETLSRWEKEHRPPDRKAMMVLGDLVLDRLKDEETALARLRALGMQRQAEGAIDLTDSLRAA